MSSKIVNKFINEPDTCIDDNLKGLVQLYPGLKLIANHRTVVINYENSALRLEETPTCRCVTTGTKKNIVYQDNNVGVISGGGGGHEPFAAGFVGFGMLNGAVSGSVFASPPPGNVLYAIRTIAKINKGGVLVIIPNYTGDCLNFGLAIEEAIEEDGIRVESIIVNDDCALISKVANEENKSKVGARGLGALVIVQKISGAMACNGSHLDDIVNMLKNNILNNIGSMGCCIKACSLPGQPLLFELNDGEIEMGVGIHGESGFKREKFTNLLDVLDTLVSKILTNVNINANDSIVILVNNLGGLSKLEENIIVNQLVNILNNKYNLNVLRIYAGHLVTSLEMQGVQITMLNVKESVQKQILKCLDAPTEAPGWPGTKYSVNYTNNNVDSITEDDIYNVVSRALKGAVKVISDVNVRTLKASIFKAAQSIIDNEQYLNKLDSGCGDGDCGSTLKLLADEIISTHLNQFPSVPSEMFKYLSSIAQNKMGGTSGAIYSLFFNGLIKYIKATSKPSDNLCWSEALNSGLASILKYSKARLGDRTMLDVLIPVCEEIKTMKFSEFTNAETKDALNKINKTANDSCAKTKYMKAQAGRAAYVGYQEEQEVDAGAYGTKLIINNIVEQIIESL